jgi:hypothetical protein
MAYQIGRGAYATLTSTLISIGPPVKKHRIRLDYGGEPTIVDDD